MKTYTDTQLLDFLIIGKEKHLYCDYETALWTVHEVTGNINDRESHAISEECISARFALYDAMNKEGL